MRGEPHRRRGGEAGRGEPHRGRGVKRGEGNRSIGEGEAGGGPRLVEVGKQAHGAGGGGIGLESRWYLDDTSRVVGSDPQPSYRPKARSHPDICDV